MRYVQVINWFPNGWPFHYRDWKKSKYLSRILDFSIVVFWVEFRFWQKDVRP